MNEWINNPLKLKWIERIEFDFVGEESRRSESRKQKGPDFIV